MTDDHPDSQAEMAARTDTAPWWQSGAEHLAPGDPVALHLAARNGVAMAPTAPDSSTQSRHPSHPTHDVGGGHGVGGTSDDPNQDGDRDEHDRPHPDRPHADTADHNDCDVCPICRGLAHVRATHPELAEHFVAAARHLTLAMREVVDGLGDVAPRGRGATDRGAQDPPRGASRTTSTADGAAASHATGGGHRQWGGFESITLDDVDDDDDDGDGDVDDSDNFSDFDRGGDSAEMDDSAPAGNDK